jgi:hypothetical protein
LVGFGLREGETTRLFVLLPEPLTFTCHAQAYYRRASGNFALGKYKLALKDFRHVCKLEPQVASLKFRFVNVVRVLSGKLQWITAGSSIRINLRECG